MATSTLLLIGIVVFVIGGLSGFLLAALLQIARSSDGRGPTLDARGLHPLALPTAALDGLTATPRGPADASR